MKVSESKTEKFKQGCQTCMLIIKYKMLHCNICICLSMWSCVHLLVGSATYTLTYVHSYICTYMTVWPKEWLLFTREYVPALVWLNINNRAIEYAL